MSSHVLLSLILLKCAKIREPKDKHCVSQCTSVHVTPYPWTTSRLIYNQHCCTKQWMNKILSSFYDPHLDGLIN